jgi:polyferredoxin
MGRQGWFAEGAPWRGFADQFFEVADWKVARLPEADRAGAIAFGAERSYWRVIGFVLAWPLVVANWFTDRPMWGWLIVGSLQTFVLIPWLIRRFGKGAYCGWICSCGALAETLGDAHRHKMPHGPRATRWNMVGQVFLAFAVALMLLRIASWIFPASPAGAIFHFLLKGPPLGPGLPLFNYEYFVDLLWSGIIGVAFYFHLSGRMWCRFACPLAALMHIYARFSRFRIFAEKKKCISCNVCTSDCHQGIDIMNFANMGLPMEDPQCVRCSACVQQCPTGVLALGQLADGGVPLLDRLAASPVRMRESAKA